MKATKKKSRVTSLVPGVTSDFALRFGLLGLQYSTAPFSLHTPVLSLTTRNFIYIITFRPDLSNLKAAIPTKT